MPEAADGVRAAGPAGFLRLTDEQARALISSQPIHQLYEVEEKPFARGQYAAVRRCRPRGAGAGAPWRFAAKYLRKWRRAADLRAEILHEVAILHACRRSARVVRLFAVFDSEHEMVLLLELAEGGELQTLLDRDLVPDEAQVRHLMRHILLGLRDLHDLNVAHLDIKPQNLVLTGEFPNCDVKLCDLGISRYVGEGADVRDMLGTPDYVAPEVLNYEPISLATDMWSAGVLIYVLLTGCSPFGGDTKQETFCNIAQCNLDFPDDLFEDISEDAKDLMRKLMVKEPSKRLTVEQALQHTWFSATDVPSPIGAVREPNSEISLRNSFREADRISSVVAGKFEKSSPALSKKLDRPSPTLMRKPGKEIPEVMKSTDIPDDIPKRTIPVTRDAPPRMESSPQNNTTLIGPTLTIENGLPKDVPEENDSNMTERTNCGMRSFRKSTFKKNMGSILERVTSCEDFENNNGFTSTGNKNNSNNSPKEACKKTETSTISSTSINNSNNSIRASNNITSNSNNNSNDNTSNKHNESNSGNNFRNNSKNIKSESVTHVSSINITTSASNTSSPSSTSSVMTSSKANAECKISGGSTKTSTVALNRAIFETSKQIMRLNTSSKKVPAPETPAENSSASIASLTMSRPNRATVMKTMPLGGVRDFRLKFEVPSSESSVTKNLTSFTTSRHNSTTTLSNSVSTSSLTTSSISSSSLRVTPSRVSVVVTPSTTTLTHSGRSLVKSVETDCVYTFRKCYIIDDGENENGNSLVSDGTNESEASSGYYDNSSCCSSSDSVSDVSETSADSAGDRLSTASMDSLDSCYGKEKRPYSSTLATFSLKNSYNKRISTLKPDVNSKTHQSPAFHLAVSTFNRITENSNKILNQTEEMEQERIFAAARRQAAKASHTTVINKVPRSSFAPTTQPNPVMHKVCALNITKERNGNEVVLQEVKAGKCSRFSEVKIESVQSRIKKFQI